MLRMYNFDQNSLIEFVRDAITNFIDDESPAIRKEAALTCCKLAIDEPPETNQNVFVDSRYRNPELAQFPLVHFNSNGGDLKYQVPFSCFCCWGRCGCRDGANQRLAVITS